MTNTVRSWEKELFNRIDNNSQKNHELLSLVEAYEELKLPKLSEKDLLRKARETYQNLELDND